jgi:predicted RNase H-like HicB family nuclease
MSENLEQQARELASKPYHIVISREEIADGKYVFFLSYLELPGCDAQGDTLEEAKTELEEVAYEYILGYLQDGVPVPAPYATSQTTGRSQVSKQNVASAPYPTVDRTSWEEKSHVFAPTKEA